MFLIVFIFKYVLSRYITFKQFLKLILLSIFFTTLFFRLLKYRGWNELSLGEFDPVYVGEEGIFLDLVQARPLSRVLVQYLGQEFLGLRGQVFRQL